ncbi:hypothetical protein VCHENC02_1040B, partial [Vibrio harveyi]
RCRLRYQTAIPFSYQSVKV